MILISFLCMQNASNLIHRIIMEVAMSNTEVGFQKARIYTFHGSFGVLCEVAVFIVYCPMCDVGWGSLHGLAILGR